MEQTSQGKDQQDANTQDDQQSTTANHNNSVENTNVSNSGHELEVIEPSTNDSIDHENVAIHNGRQRSNSANKADDCDSMESSRFGSEFPNLSLYGSRRQSPATSNEMLINANRMHRMQADIKINEKELLSTNLSNLNQSDIRSDSARFRLDPASDFALTNERYSIWSHYMQVFNSVCFS